MTVMDESDPFADYWPPRLPPLLTAHEVDGIDDPLLAAVQIARQGVDAGLVAYSPSRRRLSFAIVLVPELALLKALQMAPLMMVALGDAIGGLAPPEVGVTYRWPMTVLINGGVAGRCRLAASTALLGATPDWLVVAADLTLERELTAEPGDASAALLMDETSLYEEGGSGFALAGLIEASTKQFLNGLNRWESSGFRTAHQAWSARAEPGMIIGGKRFVGLDEDGRALVGEGAEALSLSLVAELERVPA